MEVNGSTFEHVHLSQPAVQVERLSWRLAAMSSLIGAVAALAAAGVRLGFRGLQWLLTASAADAPSAALQLPPWRRLLTPLLGALLASLVIWMQRRRAQSAHRESGHYVEYVEAVRHRAGQIPFTENLWRTLSAAFSVASGAAVGREGSMIQFASAVASNVARWSRLAVEPAVPLGFLVACGVVGGVTAAYNAPVASVCFAAEIVLGGFQWREIPLLSLAAASGWIVSATVLGASRLYPLSMEVHLQWHLALLLPMAVLLAFVGPVYQRSLSALKQARRLPLALLWGGATVGALSLLDTRVWGNGDAGLRLALGIVSPSNAQSSLWQLLLLRLTATLTCVWTGTVGGVFTPTLFAGAALGTLALQMFPHGSADPLWAVAGMSFLMAAVTHAPWMAAFMAVELTGTWFLLPLLLPLNLLAAGISSWISPRAMYAIASQVPDAHPPSAVRGATVELQGRQQ